MIDPKRFERIKKHLLLLEKKAGMPLRDKPRYQKKDSCPILNFAPDENKKGLLFVAGYNLGGAALSVLGHLAYMSRPEASRIIAGEECPAVYPIYLYEDSVWWSGLSAPECREYTSAIIKWLKERK